jgi:hypothetical protein
MLARSLRTRHRWCISGTPLHHGLDDILGLLTFMEIPPFSAVTKTWTMGLLPLYRSRHPWATVALPALLHHVMWRTVKADIGSELQLPEQRLHTIFLGHSSVEAEFYQRISQQELGRARAVLGKSSDRHLSLSARKRLLKSLVRLRQAAVHPQAGKQKGFRALAQGIYTMTELLQTLRQTAQVELEETARLYCLNLNGRAAIALLLNDAETAAAAYREVLSLSAKHEGLLRVDPLQQIHALFHLSAIAPAQATLSEHMQQLEAAFLATITATLSKDVGTLQQLRRDQTAMKAAYQSAALGVVFSAEVVALETADAWFLGWWEVVCDHPDDFGLPPRWTVKLRQEVGAQLADFSRQSGLLHYGGPSDEITEPAALCQWLMTAYRGLLQQRGIAAQLVTQRR